MKKISNIHEQEILNDFLEILPQNLDKETNKVIEEYIGMLMKNITLFEEFEGISDETLDIIIRTLINNFKLLVGLLIKNNGNE
nr:hypothetical protein [Candidatus Gracilibacteria bacterium]